MSPISNSTIMESLQRSAQKYGVKELAAELNKSPATLYSELNPWAEPGKAKMGLLDAKEISRLTQNFAWLEMFCEDLGFHLVPNDASPDMKTVPEEICQDTERMGEWAAVCMNPDATKLEVQEAAHKLRCEIYETEKLKLDKLQTGTK